MKPVVSRSCSCTSCLYHTNFERLSLRNILDDNTKIDKLYIGNHIPIRERKLISKLVRTRAIYDDIKAELLSKSSTCPRDRTELRLHKRVTTNANDEVMPRFVAMIDKGLAPRINECGCCKCSSSIEVEESASRNPHPHSLQRQESLAQRQRNQRLREVNAFMRSRIIERQRIERNLQLMRNKTAAARIALSNTKGEGPNKGAFTETQPIIRPNTRVNVSNKMQMHTKNSVEIIRKSFKDQSVQSDTESEITEIEKHTSVKNCVPEECLKILIRQKSRRNKLVGAKNISKRLNETQTRIITSGITTQTSTLGKTVQIGTEKHTDHKKTIKEVPRVDINTSAIRLANARIIGTNMMNTARTSRSVHPIPNITKDTAPRSISTGTITNKIEKAISTIHISPETRETNTNRNIKDTEATVLPVIQKNAIKLQVKEKKPKTKEVALANNYVKRVNKKTHFEEIKDLVTCECRENPKLVNKETSQYSVKKSKKATTIYVRKPAAGQAIRLKNLKNNKNMENRLGKQIIRQSQGNLAKSFLKAKKGMKRCFCTATLDKKKLLADPVSVSHAKGIMIRRESALMRAKLYSLNRAVKSTSNIATSSSKTSSRRRRKRVQKRSVLHKVASDNTRKTDKDMNDIKIAKKYFHERGSQGDAATNKTNKAISVQPQRKQKNFIAKTLAKCLSVLKIKKNTKNYINKVNNQPKRYFNVIPRNVKYHKCEPNVCIPQPGECDARRCLQTLKLKARPRDARVATQKSTSSLSHTVETSSEKIGRKQPTTTNSLQAVKIGSSFSFNVEFYKELQVQPQKYKQMHPNTKTVFSLDKKSDLKAVKPAEIYTVSRLEFATNMMQNPIDRKERSFNRITRRITDCSKTAMLKLSLMNISSVSDLNILYGTNLFQGHKLLFEKQSAPLELSRKKFKENTANTVSNYKSSKSINSLTGFSPYMKTSICVMNVQNAQRSPKGYTLKQYECEPGVCVPSPYYCDPRECLELIKRRSGRRHSIPSTSSSLRSTSSQSSRDVRTKNLQSRQKRPPPVFEKRIAGGFSYVSKPKRLPQQVQISSIFNTTNKETEDTISDVKPRAMSPKQKKKTKRIKVSSAKSTSKGRNSSQSQIDLITTTSSVMSDRLKRCLCILKSKQNLDKSTEERNRDFESQEYMSKKSSITPMPKRCFCTLKLQKMGRREIRQPVKPVINQNTMTEQTRRRQESKSQNIQNTNRMQPMHTLGPNECEPFVCIPVPGVCDPKECLKLIKIRKQTYRHQETESTVSTVDERHGTDSSSAGRKSILMHSKYPQKQKHSSQTTSYKKDSATSTDNSTPRRSRHISWQDSEKKPARQDVIITKPTPRYMKRYERPRSDNTSEENTPDVMSSQGSANRQTVRIGSSFSFNVEFFKENIPDTERIKEADTELKARPKKVKQKTRRKKNEKRCDCVSHDSYYDDSQSSATRTDSRSTENTDILKRCFCTLKLLKKKKATKKYKPISQGTNTPPIKVPMLYERSTQDTREHHPHIEEYLHDKGTQQKKSIPHKCGPGFCVHECDPYECEGRLLKEAGTTTTPNRTASIMPSVRSKLRSKRYYRPLHSLKDNREPDSAQSSAVIIHQKNKSRQTVRLGSSFSFNIEFHKDRYTDPSFPLRNAANYQPSEYALEQPYQKPSSKLKQLHPPHYLSESRSTVSRYARDPQRIKSTAASLKRCFCTLALQKPRQDPVNVFQVTDLTNDFNKQRTIDNVNKHINGREAAEQPPSVRTHRNYVTRENKKHERNLQTLTCRVKSSVSRVSPFLQDCFKRKQLGKSKIEKHVVKARTSQERKLTTDCNVNNANPVVEPHKSAGSILKRCLFSFKNKKESLPKDMTIDRSFTTMNAKNYPFKINSSNKAIDCDDKLIKRPRNYIMMNNKLNSGAQKIRAVNKSKITGIVPLLKRSFWAMRITQSQDKKNTNKYNKPRALDDTKDILLGSKRFKALQKSNVSALEPYECPPRFCVPGACDAFDCFERLGKRNRQTTGTTTTISAGTGNRSAKKVQTENRRRDFQVVQTSRKALHEKTCQTCQLSRHFVVEEPRFPKFLNVDKKNRHAVRITSDFRFNVEIFKDGNNIVEMDKKGLKSKHQTLPSGYPKTLNKSCGTNCKKPFYRSSKLLNTQINSEVVKNRHIVQDDRKREQNYTKTFENSINFQESSRKNKKLREKQMSNTKDVVILLPYKPQKFNNKSSKTVVGDLFLCDNKCCAKRNVHKRNKNIDFLNQTKNKINNTSGVKNLGEIPQNGWNVKKICTCLAGIFSKNEKHASVCEIKEPKVKKNKKNLRSTDFLKGTKSDRQTINPSTKVKQSKSMKLLKNPERRIRHEVFYFEQGRNQYSKWQSGDTGQSLSHDISKSFKYPSDKVPEGEENYKKSLFHKEHTVQLAMITQNKIGKFSEKVCDGDYCSTQMNIMCPCTTTKVKNKILQDKKKTTPKQAQPNIKIKTTKVENEPCCCSKNKKYYGPSPTQTNNKCHCTTTLNSKRTQDKKKITNKLAKVNRRTENIKAENEPCYCSKNKKYYGPIPTQTNIKCPCTTTANSKRMQDKKKITNKQAKVNKRTENNKAENESCYCSKNKNGVDNQSRKKQVKTICVDNVTKFKKCDSTKRDPNDNIQSPHAHVCKSKNPCKCCLGSAQKLPSSKKKIPDKKGNKGICVAECKTVTKKDPKTKTKSHKQECSPKPLFDMTMEAESLKLLNRDQIYDKVMAQKRKSITPSAELLKLHGMSCECCFCRGKRKAQMVQSKFKKSPCICGSTKCEEKYNREVMEKKRLRDLKKKHKKCVCGSKICAGESLQLAVKHKIVNKSHVKKMKKKGLTAKQTRSQNAKDKKSRRAAALRQKRYKREDALRRKRQLKEDKLALKQIRKYKNSGNVILCAESVIDVIKFVLTSAAGMLRCFCRTIMDPKLTFQKLRDSKDDPRRALTSIYHVISDSGIRPTAKRVGLRMRYMPCVKTAVSKMEQYPATSYLVHAFDKNPKARLKKQPKKRVRKREPMDFECSLYMASLRKRPHLWVFYKCRWFYPHCVSMMNIFRQFTDVCLFLLAVLVWSPCIIAMEICRTSMCCTMCTA